MKKFFTLIALAAMAINGNAQEQYAISDGWTPTNGEEIQATSSVKLKFGTDNKWANKPETTLSGYTNFLTGSQNPKDGEPTEEGKATGNGYKSSTQNLPQSGVFYVFTPSAAGTIKLAVQLNADKSFIFANAEDGSCISDKVTFADADGNAVSYQEGGENEFSLSDKLVGYASFPVEANKSYYIFCVGSKLGIYGFEFVASGAPVTSDTWTVAGSGAILGSTWDPADASNDMTTTDGKIYTLVKENCTLENGTTYEYKVAKDHGWGESYPGSNATLTVDATAIYKVTFTFNSETKDVSAVAEKTGEAGVVEHTYDVKGNFFNDESWEKVYPMTKGDNGLWTVTIDGLDAGKYEFKVRQDNSWDVSYPSSNYQVEIEANASSLTITFNPENKDIETTVSASTGISAVKAAQQSAEIYNLAGQKVSDSYKGVVIMNGRKVVIK